MPDQTTGPMGSAAPNVECVPPYQKATASRLGSFRDQKAQTLIYSIMSSVMRDTTLCEKLGIHRTPTGAYSSDVIERINKVQMSVSTDIEKHRRLFTNLDTLDEIKQDVIQGMSFFLGTIGLSDSLWARVSKARDNAKSFDSGYVGDQLEQAYGCIDIEDLSYLKQKSEATLVHYVRHNNPEYFIPTVGNSLTKLININTGVMESMGFIVNEAYSTLYPIKPGEHNTVKYHSCFNNMFQEVSKLNLSAVLRRLHEEIYRYEF